MPIPIARFRDDLAPTMADLETMVRMESPTTTKALIDDLGAWLGPQVESLGFSVERIPEAKAGDHWLCRSSAERGGILLLHHLDTVYPAGTLATTSWRLEAGRAFGPGVLDMKGGIAVTLAALRGLRAHGLEPSRPVLCLFTSDEETGSRSSRSLIEALARSVDLILCLEPALPDGGLKTQRKGTGIFQVETFGRAAHAGNNPEAGVHAIEEMAHQIPAIHALASPSAGTTVSVGVIRGGTRTNVIPASCLAKLDVRVADPNERPRIDAGLAALRPMVEGARIEVRGGWNRPPMPRTPAIAGAFEQARQIADTIGIQLTEGGAGGGSDANFVAALGLPVLDGLGPIGDGAHSTDEYVEIESLAPRAALLAALLTDW